jgi:phosphoribosyl-AMP cyclohydrolase
MHRHDAKGFLKMSFDPASLSYNAAGLIPAIAQDETSGEILMMAWMNQDAVRQTLDSGRVTYWSRSRQAFWVKG